MHGASENSAPRVSATTRSPRNPPRTGAAQNNAAVNRAKACPVERFALEVFVPRNVPVRPEPILTVIAERVLGLPGTY